MLHELIAENINGVYVGEAPANSDFLIDEDFYEALARVVEGETIYGLVSDSVAAKIEAEYGIH